MTEEENVTIEPVSATAEQVEQTVTKPSTLEEAQSIMEQLKITFKGSKILCNGNETAESVIDMLLKNRNTTVAEIRTIIANANKKEYKIPEDFRRIKKLYECEVVAPAFAADVKWNPADNRLFRYFKLAKTSENASDRVLLISNGEGGNIAIPMGSNKLDNLADITSACTALMVTDENGVRRTLHDQIEREYNNLMSEALATYKQTENVEDFGNWAARKGLPSMMLNNCKLMSIREDKTVETDPNTKETLYKVHSLSFPENPFQIVAMHYDSLAGVPSRLCQLPKLFSNDPDEDALFHIDLDQILDTEGTHPTWDHYMKRYTDAEGKVFKAFLWSIFDARNTGRQMLYIYDPQGFSGKSMAMAALAEALGPNLVAAMQKDTLNNRFGFAKVWNKRCTIIDDNKNTLLLKSEKMHQLLGNGYAEIEPKGKSSFTARLQSKVIANGNVQLSIDTDAAHERTRVIVIEPKLTDDMLKEFVVLDEHGNVKRDRNGRPQYIGDTTFGDRLKSEFRSFLVECRDAYAELCPTRSSIILPDEMLEKIDNLSDNFTDTIDDSIELRFAFDKASFMPVTEFNVVLHHVIDEIERKLGIGMSGDKRLDADYIYQHMVKRYGIFKAQKRIGGKNTKCIIGVQKSDSQPPVWNGINVAKASEIPQGNIINLLGEDGSEDE